MRAPRTDVLPPFLKLLRDSEAEVRVAAASKVASISNLLEIDAVCSYLAFILTAALNLPVIKFCQHCAAVVHVSHPSFDGMFCLMARRWPQPAQSLCLQ